MTLTPSEFVRWQVDGAHHTGRVMRTPSQWGVISDEDGYTSTPEGKTHVLVRHSFTHDLEFVPWGQLVVCPEEHAE